MASLGRVIVSTRHYRLRGGRLCVSLLEQLLETTIEVPRADNRDDGRNDQEDDCENGERRERLSDRKVIGNPGSVGAIHPDKLEEEVCERSEPNELRDVRT